MVMYIESVWVGDYIIVGVCLYRMDRKLRIEQSQQNRQLMNEQLEEWQKAVDHHTRAVST